MRNPKWTQDEVILTLDFYFRHRDNERLLRKTYEPIQQLSETLNRLADTRQIERLPSFRNVNGLIRYLGCIAVLDPNWTRNEWRGRAGKIFEETWLHLGDKPDEVAALAQSILAHLEEAEKPANRLQRILAIRTSICLHRVWKGGCCRSVTCAANAIRDWSRS